MRSTSDGGKNNRTGFEFARDSIKYPEQDDDFYISLADARLLMSISFEYCWEYLRLIEEILMSLADLVYSNGCERATALRDWWWLSVQYWNVSERNAKYRFQAVPVATEKKYESAAYWRLNRATQLSVLCPGTSIFIHALMDFCLDLESQHREYIAKLRSIEGQKDYYDVFLLKTAGDEWLLSKMEGEAFKTEIIPLALELIKETKAKLRSYIVSNSTLSPFAFLKEDGGIDWNQTYPFLRAFNIDRIVFRNGLFRSLKEPMKGTGRYNPFREDYNRAFNLYNSTKYCLHPRCLINEPLPPAKKGDINVHEECRPSLKSMRNYYKKSLEKRNQEPSA